MGKFSACAHPIIRGRAYRVTSHGRTLTVLADHPCVAIIRAIQAWRAA